jgi:hypothetical protein
MSQQTPDNIDPKEATEAKLCAYLENELPPAERAEIEKYLESNPQHRQLLLELGKTRELLRSLPHEPAPVDLAEAFGERLERSMLLDGAGSNSPSLVPVRRWPQMMMLAAMVLLAAGLGVVIYVVLPSRNGPSPKYSAATPPPAPTLTPMAATTAPSAAPTAPPVSVATALDATAAHGMTERMAKVAATPTDEAGRIATESRGDLAKAGEAPAATAQPAPPPPVAVASTPITSAPVNSRLAMKAPQFNRAGGGGGRENEDLRLGTRSDVISNGFQIANGIDSNSTNQIITLNGGRASGFGGGGGGGAVAGGGFAAAAAVAPSLQLDAKELNDRLNRSTSEVRKLGGGQNGTLYVVVCADDPNAAAQQVRDYFTTNRISYQPLAADDAGAMTINGLAQATAANNSQSLQKQSIALNVKPPPQRMRGMSAAGDRQMLAKGSSYTGNAGPAAEKKETLGDGNAGANETVAAGATVDAPQAQQQPVPSQYGDYAMKTGAAYSLNKNGPTGGASGGRESSPAKIAAKSGATDQMEAQQPAPAPAGEGNGNGNALAQTQQQQSLSNYGLPANSSNSNTNAGAMNSQAPVAQQETQQNRKLQFDTDAQQPQPQQQVVTKDAANAGAQQPQMFEAAQQPQPQVQLGASQAGTSAVANAPAAEQENSTTLSTSASADAYFCPGLTRGEAVQLSAMLSTQRMGQTAALLADTEAAANASAGKALLGIPAIALSKTPTTLPSADQTVAFGSVTTPLPPAAVAAPATTAPSFVGTLADDVSDKSTINRGDPLSVTVSELVGPGLDKSNTVRVAEDGTITLPMLVDPLHAAGQTPPELQRQIADKYRDAHLFPSATVSVRRLPATTQPTAAVAEVSATQQPLQQTAEWKQLLEGGGGTTQTPAGPAPAAAPTSEPVLKSREELDAEKVDVVVLVQKSAAVPAAGAAAVQTAEPATQPAPTEQAK